MSAYLVALVTLACLLPISGCASAPPEDPAEPDQLDEVDEKPSSAPNAKETSHADLPPAGTTDPSHADKATARQLFADADDDVRRGDNAAALDKYLRAYQLIQVPTLLLEIGRTARKLGRNDLAQKALHMASTFPTQPDEPPVFKRARQEAWRLLGQTKP